jgi:cation:H+ antiporter
MATVLLTFLGAAAIIVLAGIFLTKYGDAIAEITGLGRLLVGSILLAGATSLPGLSVDINAIRLGRPNLGAGRRRGRAPRGRGYRRC